MKNILWLAAGLVVAMYACSTERTATSVLQGAQKAIGNPNSIQYSGTGMNSFVGQAQLAGEEWPRRDLASVTRTINYEQRSMRTELGFAQPTFGGQQQNAQVSGDKAWNIGPNGPVPQPAAAEERQLQILLTPHGFVRGALAAGNASLSGPPEASVISYTALVN
jgi:hypothetical protein